MSSNAFSWVDAESNVYKIKYVKVGADFPSYLETRIVTFYRGLTSKPCAEIVSGRVTKSALDSTIYLDTLLPSMA